MSKIYLLIGAGFSRNWGGWLASEAFEYLVGCPELQDQKSILQLLWDHRNGEGFEGTLAALQQSARSSRKNEDKAAVAVLTKSIRQMFSDMNRSFLNQGCRFEDYERTFLTNFDAIFSLNQDLLLELQYLDIMFPIGGGAKKWNAATTPGVNLPGFRPLDYDASDWLSRRWRVQPDFNNQIPKRTQPIFKLHGSSQWYRDDDQDGVLVLGGQKSSFITSDPLLLWYQGEFSNALKQSGSKLMIVGYGFRDHHINSVISDAISHGLKIFVVGPDGADSWTETPNAGPGIIHGKNFLEMALIGATRRPFREALNGNSIEAIKLRRFFDN